MKTLVWVEHENGAVKDATFAVVTAAAKLGSVALLVAGSGVGAVATAAAAIAGVDEVLSADNAAYAHALPENVAPLIVALMADHLDILFANEDEAKALFEEEEFGAVVKKFQAWGGIAAITRSAKGCVVIKGGEVHEVPAAPVAKVVDTTGAGDQFAAGFLFGMTHGKSLADCGKLGSLAAAEVISHYGARPETSLKALAEKMGLI